MNKPVFLFTLLTLGITRVSPASVRWSRTRDPLAHIDTLPLTDKWHFQIFDRDPELSHVNVDGCVYYIPWRTAGLRLQTNCEWRLPVCGPGHSIAFRVNPAPGTHVLWEFRWDDVQSTATTVEGGTWITFGEEVFVGPPIPIGTWTSVSMEWSRYWFVITIETGPGLDHHIRVRWTLPLSPGFVSCRLVGASPTPLRVTGVQIDSGDTLLTHELLARAWPPGECIVEKTLGPYESGQWIVNHHSAHLQIQLIDLIRCRQEAFIQWNRFDGQIALWGRNGTIVGSWSYQLKGTPEEDTHLFTDDISQPIITQQSN